VEGGGALFMLVTPLVFYKPDSEHTIHQYWAKLAFPLENVS